jgi:hypothetical protein
MAQQNESKTGCYQARESDTYQKVVDNLFRKLFLDEAAVGVLYCSSMSIRREIQLLHYGFF